MTVDRLPTLYPRRLTDPRTRHLATPHLRRLATLHARYLAAVDRVTTLLPRQQEDGWGSPATVDVLTILRQPIS